MPTWSPFCIGAGRAGNLLQMPMQSALGRHPSGSELLDQPLPQLTKSGWLVEGIDESLEFGVLCNFADTATAAEEAMGSALDRLLQGVGVVGGLGKNKVEGGGENLEGLPGVNPGETGDNLSGAILN
jgi:hypothetical protein